MFNREDCRVQGIMSFGVIEYFSYEMKAFIKINIQILSDLKQLKTLIERNLSLIILLIWKKNIF